MWDRPNMFLAFRPVQAYIEKPSGHDKLQAPSVPHNGHAFGLLSEAMQFLTRHLPVAGRIEAGLFERVDEHHIPPIALREALVNTFCHGDYAQAGWAVSVAIYDDRLEIWSSGGLPLGMEVEELNDLL